MKLYENYAFFKREIVDDGMGNQSGKYTKQFETKAAISYRQGSETVQAARLQGKQPAFLTIRNFQAARQITTDWCCCDIRGTRFDDETGAFDGQVYNIRAIYVDPFNRQYIRLTLEGGVAV